MLCCSRENVLPAPQLGVTLRLGAVLLMTASQGSGRAGEEMTPEV